MTYSANGLIEASDYNTLRTAYNTLWGVGLGDVGLGQTTTLDSVSSPDKVTSTEWKNLANGIINLGKHQDSVMTTLPTFNSGDLIKYVEALQTNLTTLESDRGSAKAQGTLISNSTETTTAWNDQLTFTQTLTFASGDAARYFFNAGGQIVVQPSMTKSNNATGSLLFNRIASLCGSWIISGRGGKIVGTQYTPFTIIGGVAGATVDTTLGYYDLTTSYQQAAKVFNDTSLGGAYKAGSYISLEIKTDGTVGSNNDNGKTLTLKTIFNEVPNGLTVSGTSKVSVFIKPPSSTYVTNKWGTVTFSGSVTGS